MEYYDPNTAAFRERLVEGGVLLPQGTHHEFAYGAHGQKVDFDTIADGSPLYEEWVDMNVRQLQQRLAEPPLAFAGVANGTNRLARDVGARLGIMALETRKVSPSQVELLPDARAWLAAQTVTGLVVALEDVGTTGGTALTALRSAQAAGAVDIAAQFSWKRTGELGAFTSSRIPHWAIIDEPLPTYTPTQCREYGFCARGWKLVPHAS